MLARLQQVTTFGALFAAALWAWLFWRAGHPVWAMAGALLLVGGYSLVLAFEFALLRLAHGTDPTPRATAAQLVRAWWGEVRAAPIVFCWRQPFFSQRWPDRLPADAQGRRGVLLVHGFVCNRGIWNPWLQRLHAAQVPLIAVNLEPVFGSIDEYIPAIDAAVVRLQQCTGLAPVIVAHSMGGLVARAYVRAHGSASVAHIFTLGTPHHGTSLASFGPGANAAQMRRCADPEAPESGWLRELAATESPATRALITSIFTHHDNIVAPQTSSQLPGARHIEFGGVGHVALGRNPRVLARLMDELVSLRSS